MISKSELIRKVNKSGSYYFTPETLRAWGERVQDMRIYPKTAMIDDNGTPRECYILMKYGRGYNGEMLTSYAYFTVDGCEVMHTNGGMYDAPQVIRDDITNYIFTSPAAFLDIASAATGRRFTGVFCEDLAPMIEYIVNNETPAQILETLRDAGAFN